VVVSIVSVTPYCEAEIIQMYHNINWTAKIFAAIRIPHVSQTLGLLLSAHKKTTQRNWVVLLLAERGGFGRPGATPAAKIFAAIRIPRVSQTLGLLLSAHKKTTQKNWVVLLLAERGGFEPPVGY
jgi:hypothetical protein